MGRFRRNLVLWTLTLLGATSSGFAADQPEAPECDETQDLKSCYQLVFDTLKAEWETSQPEFEKAVEALQPKVVAENQRQKTTPSGQSNTSSSLANLLPRVIGALGIDGLDFDEGDLQYEQNFDLGDDWILTIGATAFLSPTVYEPLKESIPEANRSDVITILEDRIEDFDKVDFKARFARERYFGENRIGRDAKGYEDLLTVWRDELRTQGLLNSSTGLAGLTTSDEPVIAMAFQKWGEKEPGLLSVSIEKLTPDLTVAERDALVEAVRSEASEAFVFVTDLEATEEKIYALVQNQPQSFAQYLRKDRRGVAGPNEESITVCYEMGVGGNINDFMRWARMNPQQCPGSDWRPTASGLKAPGYRCLERYLNSRRQPDAGNRLAFALSYQESDAFSFSETVKDTAIDVSVNASEKTIASLTYGRYFKGFQLIKSDTSDAARIDLEAKYEDVSDDPMRQDRLVSTLTFTQRATQDTDFVLSLVYANKPEFRGAVDEEVSAKLGFKWNLETRSGD